MGKQRGRQWLPWFAVLVFGACGCGQDAERLARVARHLGDKMDVFAGAADGQLPAWPILRPGLEQMGLDARVAARLGWDKGLEGSQIQVSARDGVIELKGTVQDLSQQRRAVDLAGSTAGVADVVDNLQIAK